MRACPRICLIRDVWLSDQINLIFTHPDHYAGSYHESILSFIDNETISRAEFDECHGGKK